MYLAVIMKFWCRRQLGSVLILTPYQQDFYFEYLQGKYIIYFTYTNSTCFEY